MAIDPFWGNLFRRNSQEKDELYNILKEVPIFQDLNWREFHKIEGILHRRSYADDESIVREGEYLPLSWRWLQGGDWYGLAGIDRLCDHLADRQSTYPAHMYWPKVWICTPCGLSYGNGVCPCQKIIEACNQEVKDHWAFQC